MSSFGPAVCVYVHYTCVNQNLCVWSAGVPLIDGGTVRLPALIGASRAMDMILTGRAVGAKEALQMGSCTTKGKLRMRVKPYFSPACLLS